MLNKLSFKIYSIIKKLRVKTKYAYYKHLWNEQLDIKGDFLFGEYSQIQIQSGTSKLKFETGVIFRSYCNVLCSNYGILSLGKNVFFNNYCSVNCLYKITVGDNSIFGEGVKLYDHNHMFYDREKVIAEQGMKYGAIEIGKNCWIGSNCVILPNVTIGDNVVIGANNLIYKSIPADTIIMSKSDVLLKSY